MNSVQLATMAKLQNPKGVGLGFLRLLQDAKLANPARAMGNKVLADISFYHAKTVVGVGTTQTFFNGSTASQTTNLSEFIRPQDEHTLITRLKFSEGINASVPATVWTQGLATAPLQNGTFTIEINGVLRLKKYPLVDSVVSTESDAGIIELLTPIVWGAQEDLKITTNFDVAPAVANTNMLVQIAGIGLV